MENKITAAQLPVLRRFAKYPQGVCTHYADKPGHIFLVKQWDKTFSKRILANLILQGFVRQMTGVYWTYIITERGKAALEQQQLKMAA